MMFFKSFTGNVGGINRFLREGTHSLLLFGVRWELESLTLFFFFN